MKVYAAALVLLISLVSNSYGAVRWMSPSGAGSGNGTSPANAWSKATAQSSQADGDTIIGLDGSYGTFVISQSITLMSSNDFGMVVTGDAGTHGVYGLDGVDDVTVVGVRVLKSYIDGFKAGGNNWKFIRCWAQGAGRGDPSWVTNTSGTFQGQGFAAHDKANTEFWYCLSEGNGAKLTQDHGFYINGTNNLMVGCISRNNDAGWGAQIYNSPGDNHNFRMYNCLFYDNGPAGLTQGEIVIETWGADKQNIFVGNTILAKSGRYAIIARFGNSSSFLDLTNNIIKSGGSLPLIAVAGTAGSTNRIRMGYNLRDSFQAGDPAGIGDVASGSFNFDDTATAKYWLAFNSPARGMALSTALFTNDFFGRVQSHVKDVGFAQFDYQLWFDDSRNLTNAARDFWVQYPHDFRVVPSATHHEVRWYKPNDFAPSYTLQRKDSVNNTYAVVAEIPKDVEFYMDPKSSMTNGVTYTYSISPTTSLGNQGGLHPRTAAIVCDRTSIIHPTRLLSWGTNIVGASNGTLSAGMTQFCNVKVSIPGTNIVAVGDGIDDDQPAIQAAIDRCPTNAYVYLPGTNTYACYTNLTLRGNNRVLRGDGASSVLLVNYSDATGEFINFGSYAEQGTQRTNIADIAIGATNATWDPVNGLGASFPSPGQVVKFWLNDASVPGDFARDGDGAGSSDPVHYSPSGSSKGAAGAPLIRFEAKITGTAVNNQVFFWPPSPYYFPSNTTLSRYLYQNETRNSGIEKVKVVIDGLVSIGIDMIQTVDCWIKDVTTTRAAKSHISVRYSVNPTLTGNTIDGAVSYGPSQGIGIHLDSHVYGFLIYDNVMRSNFPAIEAYLGASGGVIGYNYFLNSQGGLAPIDIHNAHNFKVLVEGNVGYGFIQDGYFGGAEKWTLFRNWFHGNEAAFGARKVINLGHWTRDFNVVNNVLGNPYTNWVYHIQSNGWNNAYASLYRIGYPNMGNDTYGSLSTDPQAKVYDDVDQTVWTNLLTHANIEFGSGGAWTTNYNSGITNRTYPISYFTEWNSTNPPTWWTNAVGLTNSPWPSIGVDVPGHTNLIPAMIRFHSLAAYSPPGDTNTYPPIDTNYVAYPAYIFWTPARIAPAATTPSLLRFSEKPASQDIINDGIPRQ